MALGIQAMDPFVHALIVRIVSLIMAYTVGYTNSGHGTHEVVCQKAQVSFRALA